MNNDLASGIYRPASLVLAVVFAAVGLTFLFAPEQVLILFNIFSALLGMPQSPVLVPGFYLILAAAYMYLVAVLAFFMYRHPGERIYPMLLAHAKLASAALSLYLFALQQPYLIYITNAVVDGFIGFAALVLYRQVGR